MQVEHISLGGNTTLRDTNSIYPETVELLKSFQIRQGSKTLPFPRSDFSVKITTTTEGAVFDILKNGALAVTNVCCFTEKNKPELLALVTSLHKTAGFGEPRIPVFPNWIYSIIINPFALSPGEMQTAGEIELYIYYSLYLARL